MSRLGSIALLVLILGLGIVGLGAALVDLMMLWATIGTMIVTDWWKWAVVALATLPVWLTYRLAWTHRHKRE